MSSPSVAEWNDALVSAPGWAAELPLGPIAAGTSKSRHSAAAARAAGRFLIMVRLPLRIVKTIAEIVYRTRSRNTFSQHRRDCNTAGELGTELGRRRSFSRSLQERTACRTVG